ncbi:class I SAM-dependent methyltransferase [Cognatilysobacter bugurensis]|uniref:Methyltransferase type 11 domain-containing protein n=1 Tax=Cognatilysobacter bugurensis TaxID=543356 RepID=A0A918WAT1_9GAMM|nr:methyltransferase domain-containing protein [Lysobacter bugurensis]GHA84997.1 hypothetical protein GCM10007067_23680 [Lysobacter bugurensis]
MTHPRHLFDALVTTAPFQPATNYWRAVELDAVIRHGLPSGRGLDLGCGDGKLTAIVDRASDGGRRWVGVDLDPEETALAEHGGRYEAVHTCSATAVPEPDASFDFVFSNSVLEHIPSVDEVLMEAARLLRPDGQFIATVPGPHFHALLRGPWMGGDKKKYCAQIDARCAHVRYWSPDTWRSHLSAVGLELVGVVEYLSQRQLRRWELMSAFTGGALHLLSGRRKRPIELQRMLRLRGERPGPAGALAASISRTAFSSLPMSAVDGAGPFACMLIEARRR